MSDHQTVSLARILGAVLFVAILALVAFGIQSTAEDARVLVHRNAP